jgi:hypothetical protein
MEGFFLDLPGNVRMFLDEFPIEHDELVTEDVLDVLRVSLAPVKMFRLCAVSPLIIQRHSIFYN